MVKFSTYFSRGSSREPIFPSSHSLYSISVGKILDKLAILKDGLNGIVFFFLSDNSNKTNTFERIFVPTDVF